MIKTIVALFALYESSLGNRLLLQAVPPAVPEPVAPAVPAMPVAPEPPAVPVAPQPPVTIPAPIPPVAPVAPQPPPVSPQPPAVVAPPQPPVTPPGRPLFPWELPPQPIGPPVPPTNPIQPQPQPQPFPVAPTVPIAPPVSPPGVVVTPPVTPPQPPAGFPWQRPGFLSTKLECKVSPPNPASCAGGIRTITNPSENYEILCTAPRGGCYGTTLNIELTPMGYPIDRLKLFAFIGEYAAMNAKINIRNTRGDQVRIDEVKCNKIGACQNLQITMDPGIYMEQGDVHCDFGACDGCTINGVPCYYYVEPI